MEEKRICPECGKEYSSRPALSRKDNKTMSCLKCGMKETLDTVREVFGPGMADQQWEDYKEACVSEYVKEWIEAYIMQVDARIKRHMMQFAQRKEPEHWCTGQAGQKRMRKQNCS